MIAWRIIKYTDIFSLLLIKSVSGTTKQRHRHVAMGMALDEREKRTWETAMSSTGSL
jgi:hypothetical protein